MTDSVRTQIAGLPYVDEHETTIAAGTDDVWTAVLDTLDHNFSGRAASAYARAVGCLDTTASGPRPLAEGSEIVGFHVVRAELGRRLALEGKHRFSSYALTFRLEPESPQRTRLRAETRAAFPGIAGGIYRALVISTRGHAFGMRRLLAQVRHQCESRDEPANRT